MFELQVYSVHYGGIKSCSEPLKVLQQELKEYIEVFNINVSDTSVFKILHMMLMYFSLL